ncbi:MAG: Arc family DNA-binding protein, partial [bacterium]
MPTIQIKNVPPKIYNKLKSTAKNNHRSISGEVLQILEELLIKNQNNYSDLFDEIETTKDKIESQFGISSSSV